ncbi:3-beta hydroxysteroid dehydrogenase [Marinithermofilum abyssi]|uniref:3-beta hydroxysteroid dehydrogenase n=1 Tax=Marinithermofilum abyssi TaxID=1571185 RepID=A0A8J2VIC5_9BACL|nr:SDR family oxidoreductase [Marinithermofilum abyssi]GGE15123.1 3-beta hydroxysteroid dehydrogenase [Marinithermofilum abyssi]
MANLYMLTGFPGFITSRLFHTLREQDSSAFFVFLVHPSQMKKAEKQTASEHQVRLLPGDITQEDLGLPPTEVERLKESVTYFFHLAAIYDLAVPKEAAYSVNVIGTHNVNRFVEKLSRLKRYVYFSTAYVSGEREGRVKEEELDCGQQFKNHYESTKFEAEKSVRALQNVPKTIIRPGVVVGDSRTGETAKFDGPYYIMRFLDAIRFAPIPYIGKGDNPFNIVPVDYITQATSYLAKAEKAVNRSFHLTDPSPYKARDVYRMISEQLLGKTPKFVIPGKVAEFALKARPIRKFLDVEREAIAYMSRQSDYDASQAAEVLGEGGIRCPDLAAYLPRLVQYFQEHRHDEEKRTPIP